MTDQVTRMSLKIRDEDVEFIRKNIEHMTLWIHELVGARKEVSEDWTGTQYYTPEEFEAKRREIRARSDHDE